MLKPELMRTAAVVEDPAFEADFEMRKGSLIQSRNYVKQFLIL